MLRKSKKGFTLIELLVVIAIIAILAAILFPVFAKARDKARQGACLSNVKQLALGIMMYKDDYDQMFPPNQMEEPTLVLGGDSKAEVWSQDAYVSWGWTYYYDPGFYMWSWQDLVYPYTKSMKVANCPNGGGSWGTSGGAVGIAQGHYGANCFILGFPSPLTRPGIPVIDTYGGPDGMVAAGCAIKSESAVQDPANKYLIMDWGCYYAYAGEALYPYTSHFLPGAGKYPEIAEIGKRSGDEYHAVGASNGNPDDGVWSDFVNGRHSGGVNVGYADGHAKFQTIESVLQGSRNWADNLTNRRNPVSGYVMKDDPWSPEFSK